NRRGATGAVDLHAVDVRGDVDRLATLGAGQAGRAGAGGPSSRREQVRAVAGGPPQEFVERQARAEAPAQLQLRLDQLQLRRVVAPQLRVTHQVLLDARRFAILEAVLDVRVDQLDQDGPALPRVGRQIVVDRRSRAAPPVVVEL